MNKLVIILSALISLAGCSSDPNSKPEYGDESGLPKNCRAYVPEAIDYYKANVDGYDIDFENASRSEAELIYDKREEEVEILISSLERNCGLDGELWDN